ncbi:GNAT family N-acetyltransferase [Thioalkalivibrio thiocyanodenitrificans]|uniref:GNAT family N-acetyltransferase n=1 Tax=Thioalkalivibrio thiocyanodenitrificans TaxID=243063 RepID=UPI00035FC29C|nr:GNAT family N-acetyltransferase [Thioalkalivibrio thiocyanodenitrificans]
MIHVRPAVPEDLEEVAGLFDQYRMFYGQAADFAAAHRFMADRMERGDSVVLVAEMPTGVLAGFTQMFPGFSSVAVAPVFILNDLFVAPAQRRGGVGRALLLAAAEFAQGAGAVRLSLSTAIDNRPAQALYESLGWVRNTQFHQYNLAIESSMSVEPPA